jgi:GH15 family glucan-1,4-alpha-glucosidase
MKPATDSNIKPARHSDFIPAGAPDQMQIIYGVAGQRDMLEWQPSFGLRGLAADPYPKRGRWAVTARRVGEVAAAMAQALKGGLPPHPRSQALADVLMPFLEKAWRESDEGIWEVRGGRQRFTHSKVMVWVAFDRTAELAKDVGEIEQARRWRAVTDEINAEVYEKAFDAELAVSFRHAAQSLLMRACCRLAWSVFCLPTIRDI